MYIQSIVLTKHDIYTHAEMQMHTYFIIITCCKFVFWLAFSLNCKFLCPVYFKFAKSRVLFLYWFAFDGSLAPEIVTCIFRTVKLNCNSLNTIFSLTSIITVDHFWYVLLIANIICNQERLSNECFVNIKKRSRYKKTVLYMIYFCDFTYTTTIEFCQNCIK